MNPSLEASDGFRDPPGPVWEYERRDAGRLSPAANIEDGVSLSLSGEATLRPRWCTLPLTEAEGGRGGTGGAWFVGIPRASFMCSDTDRSGPGREPAENVGWSCEFGASLLRSSSFILPHRLDTPERRRVASLCPAGLVSVNGERSGPAWFTASGDEVSVSLCPSLGHPRPTFAVPWAAGMWPAVWGRGTLGRIGFGPGFDMGFVAVRPVPTSVRGIFPLDGPIAGGMSEELASVEVNGFSCSSGTWLPRGLGGRLGFVVSND